MMNNLAYEILVERKAPQVSDINKVCEIVKPVLNEICRFFPNYTLHDIEHSLRVIDIMCKISGEDTLKKMSNLELAMMIYSALLHDIGMVISDEEVENIKNTSQFEYYLKQSGNNEMLAIQEVIRPIHGMRSYEYIKKDEELKNIMHDDVLKSIEYLDDVALICQSHMESVSWIDDNLKEDFSKGEHYNSKYIAILLRLADYIDFDSQRAPEYLLRHKKLTEKSLMEWKKHATVGNIEKINDNREIYFNIECTNFHVYCDLMDTLNDIENQVEQCVTYSQKFSDSKYHLDINEEVHKNISAKGFKAIRLAFSLDYDEISKLLMGENLYGDKKIGFRELIQNSFDACNVMQEIYKQKDPISQYHPQISVIYDYDNKEVIIKDNGIGMSKDIIDKYFLTIGKSYYRSEEFEKCGYNVKTMGAFGIGFLSCFMLSQNVSICTKHYDTGETSAFKMEKDSKYICYEDNTSFFAGHGTEIHLSMDEFIRAFSTVEQVIKYLNRNFYNSNYPIDIFRKNENNYEKIGEAKVLQASQNSNINLSPYLEGIECVASLRTLMDDFVLIDKLANVDKEKLNILLLSPKGLYIPASSRIDEYDNNKCLIMFNNIAFEIFILNMYEELGIEDISAEELIDMFERYGFQVFQEDYEMDYEDLESGEDWIDSNEPDLYNRTCIVLEGTLDIDKIFQVVAEIKQNYLSEMGIFKFDSGASEYRLNTIHCNDTYVKSYLDKGVKHSDIKMQEVLFEEQNPIINYNSNYLQVYETDLYYRGVHLSNANFVIRDIVDIFTSINITVNAFCDELTPAVTRENITEDQKHAIAYAVGRAIHLYLIDKYSDDKDFVKSIKNLINRKYNICNSLCRPIIIE